jgi:hypothetical protein
MALAGSTAFNLATGRDKELKAAMGEGMARGFIGDVKPEETIGGRVSRLATDTGKAMTSGIFEGIGRGVSSLGNTIAANPWSSAAIAGAAATPLVLHWLLTRNKSRAHQKTAGTFGRVLNSAWQTPAMRRARFAGLGITAAGAAAPLAVTSYKAYKSIQDPESIGSLLLKSPESVANRMVDAAKPRVSELLDEAASYPARHPLITAGVLGAYGLGAYALYRLLRRSPKKEPKPAMQKAAGALARLVSASVPASMLGYAAATTLAPQATGRGLGHMAGRVGAIAAGGTGPGTLVGDTIRRTLPTPDDPSYATSPVAAASDTGTRISNSIRGSAVGQFIQNHPVSSAAITGSGLAALYLLARRDDSRDDAAEVE